MELLRLEKSLLRHSSLIHSFIAPSYSSRPLVRCVHPTLSHLTSFLNADNKRCFSQLSTNAQEAAAAPASQPPEGNNPSNESSTTTRSQPPRDDPYSQLVDGLLDSKPRPSSTRNPTNVSSSLPAGNRSQSGSSVTDIAGAFSKSLSEQGPLGQSNRPRGSFSSRMVDPPSDDPRPRGHWTTHSGPPMPEKIEPPPMRLSPSIGRTVDIDSQRNMDVGKSFRRLEILCARNRIRSDFAKQRFHERPGLKRKRLKSERWRRRFKVAFKATVARVKELRSKGW